MNTLKKYRIPTSCRTKRAVHIVLYHCHQKCSQCKQHNSCNRFLVIINAVPIPIRHTQFVRLYKSPYRVDALCSTKTNCSAVIPLYLINPIAAKGNAPKIQTQLKGFRSEPWSEQEIQTHRHTAGKDRKNEPSERQSKKHTLRIITDFLIYLDFQS